MPTPLITGVTGQAGIYLVEYLLKPGCRGVGATRRAITDTGSRIAHLGEFITLGVAKLLEHIRPGKTDASFCMASTSEIFGSVHSVPQNESSMFYRRFLNRVSTLYRHWITVNYRESYGIRASSGILFNHNWPLRGLEVVTGKISYGVARIKQGITNEIRLGNLDALSDRGFSGDYVRAMRRMLQQDEPDDFVIASGEDHTVRKFCDHAFQAVGPDYLNPVVGDPAFWRPAELVPLIGDSRKARQLLGWEPGTNFAALVGSLLARDDAGRNFFAASRTSR
jgi:GDPmannose 4,6-dehydratase